MGQASLDAHVEFLKGVVQGKPGWAGSEDPVANGVATSEEPTDGSGSDAGSAAERLQAVEALYSLARSSGGGDGGGGKRDARGAAIVAAAGGGGGLEIQGKRLTKTAEFFLEAGFFAPADGAAATAMPPKTLELCRSKFFSLAADIAAKPLFWQTNFGTNKGESKSKSSKSPSKTKSTDEGGSAGWGALEALWGLHETWQGLEGGGRKLVKGLSVGVDEREACSVALAVVGRIRAGAARDDKLGSAFAGILLMVSLHMLEGSKEEARGREMERSQHITDLVETYGRMSGSAKDEEDGDDDEEEEDRDEPDPLAMLADVLVAVVAEPSTHSVRGLRDTARRVWGMVSGSTPLTRSALNTLVAAVCGDQDEGGNESSSEEEEEEDSDGDDDEEMAKNGKSGPEGKGSSDGEQEEGSSSDDSDSDSDSGENDGDKDEVMVDPSDMEALLTGEEEDEGGEEGFQHHAGADKALGALIGLKKLGRKKGAQEAERQGYQIRLRALDLLEVVCSRRSDSQHLLTVLLPVLKSIEKLSGVAAGGEGAALNIRLQSLYKNRLCKCKPRASSSSSSSSEERGSKPGDDTDDTRAQTAEAFSELIGLCRAWEKNSPLASLALEGALCCLRSLKSSPAKGKGKGGGGGGDALEGALKALAAAVGDFFGKKRGGGFTVVQVEEVVKRFPDVLSPVLVKAAQGAAASDFLRTEAFSLLAGVLQRRGSMNPASRETLLAQCPAIFKALSDVMSIAAKEAASSATGDAAETGDKKPAKASAASSSAMLKAKRLKPILGCLSATVSADEGVGALSALASEARSLKASLAAVGEASASLAMQLQCGQVAQALDAIAAAGGKEENGAAETVSEEGGSKKKRKMDKSSPKRKAAAEVDVAPDTEVDSPVKTAAAAATDDDESKLKSSSSKKKKKKRRESKEG
ncbi:unnamed protein product [Ectocarpus sp. 6 AP-2014]